MRNTEKKKIVILGAGLAGLGAGIQAQKMGHDSVILEKEDYVGGLFSNHVVKGCDFDYGPKILVDTPNTQEILKYMDGNYEKYEHDERVYLSKYGILGFPLQRNLYQLPKEEREKILNSVFDADKQDKKQINNFKDWLISNYGKYFAETILIPYEQKKWLVDLSEMDYQWALKRHLKVDRKELIEGSKGKLGQYRWYYYPKTGNITEVIKALQPHAGPIKTNHPVTKIDLDMKVVLAGNEEFEFDILINTIPMDYISKITTPFPSELEIKSETDLKRLSILIFNLAFEGNYNLDGTAIYFPEEEFIFRRVSVLENLCPALARDGMTPITAEVSVKDVNTADREEILNKVIKDLKKIAQFKQLGDPVETGTLDVQFAYPLQTNELLHTVSEIQNYLEKYGVYNAGRGGTFNYCDGDLAFVQGKDAVLEAFKETVDLEKVETVSVSVGIPVHNEEKNIGKLIESILAQETTEIVLENIFVLGDGCTDKTEDTVKDIAKNSPVVKTIFDDERHGKQVRLNELFNMNKSNVLVCLDGDVIIDSNDALQNMALAFKEENVGFVTGNDIPIKGKTFGQKLANSTELLWLEVRSLLENNSFHNSRGRFFAISQEVSERLTLPKNVLDDYYIYFWINKNGYKFRHLKDSKVIYRPPSNLAEHIKQSTKVTTGILKKNLYKHFDKEYINSETSISAMTRVKGTLKYLVKAPLYTFGALALIAIEHLYRATDKSHDTGVWETTASTKEILND